MKQLWLLRRQRDRPVNGRLLRRITLAALQELHPVGPFELAVHLVGPGTMAHLNRAYLRHEGPTDVITFNHGAEAGILYGEIYVCPRVALTQSRRYRTTWQQELVRYIVHGLLHLIGYNDNNKRARRKMKARETGLVRRLASQFPLAELGPK